MASLFYEDVAEWFDVSQFRYTPKVKFTGQSGYDHLFDFVIPKSNIQPERVVHAFNRPNRENIELFAFAWVDTKDARPVDSRAYAFLNDQDQKVSANVMAALEAYNVAPVLWSNRDDELDALAA